MACEAQLKFYNRIMKDSYLKYLPVPGILLIGILFNSCTGRLDASDFKLEIIPMSTGSEASLRALQVVDKNIIWASGSGGEYLLSANGGNSWKLGYIDGAESDDLRSIYAWNSTRALVFGTSNPGRGYLTETSGEDWQLVYENNTAGIFFNSLSFANEFKGMALGDPLDSTSFVIKTNDGGLSWEEISGLPVLLDGEANFAASNSCIQYSPSGKVRIVSGGGGSRVFLSNDDGLSWTAAESGLLSGIPSSGIFSVSFIDDNRGIIVGGTYDTPELNNNIAAFTMDGGEKWILSEVMPAQYRSCVFWMEYRGKEIAVAVGKTGVDISVDNGNSWRNVSLDGYFTGRSVPGTNIAYLAGSEGRISKIILKRRRSGSDDEL
jgi:photosystem II stability/assembly factor-like uncharacterized protein